MNCKNPKCENHTTTAKRYCSNYCKQEMNYCTMVQIGTWQESLERYDRQTLEVRK